MNIKSVGNPLTPFEVRPVEKNTRTEASQDREPNQGNEKGEESPKRHLSDQELQSAIEHLKQLSGIKDNNLTVRLVRENDIVLVFVEDPFGKVVRRIPETELSTLTKANKLKGHIIDKAS
jgi:uncharacterized FlaG/YvyC family protein